MRICVELTACGAALYKAGRRQERACTIVAFASDFLGALNDSVDSPMCFNVLLVRRRGDLCLNLERVQ